MNTKLNGVKVWPGVIGSSRSAGIAGTILGLGQGWSYHKLTGDSWKNCPSHTFEIVKRDGQLWVGESVRPKSKLTPFSEYERKLRDGKIRNLQLFEVLHISKLRQGMAADWWVRNVLNEQYDIPIFDCAWQHWCTEGVADSYAKGAAYDITEGRNPWPITIIECWKEGRLRLLGKQKVK